MSNLNSPFDVVRGWPHGGAVDEAFPVDTALTVPLTEGQLVVLVDNGGVTSVTHPPAPAAEGSATPTRLRMVIQGNDQSDGKFTGKVVTLRGEFTVKTDKFVAGAYTVGELVTWSSNVNEEGFITKRTVANEEVVGEVLEYDSVNGVLTVAMSL